MLIQFSVENFRSISDKKTFSMIPSKGSSKPYNLIKLEKKAIVSRLLKSSVIYGANASGKSNLLRALHVMKRLVLTSKTMNKGDTFGEYDPFILDTNYSKKPTYFEIFFIIENTPYKYSFSYNLERIITENLSYFVGKKEISIFKRENEIFEPFIDHSELAVLFQHTGDNVLFLSKANNEYKKFGPVFEWFNKKLIVIGSLSTFSEKSTIEYMNESEQNRGNILKFLQFADLDISNVVGENKKVDDPKFIESFKTFIASIELPLPTDNRKDIFEIEVPEIKSVRRRVDGSEVIRDFKSFESSGTKQMFKIAGLWLETLLNKNRVLIIDEFDIKLHPDLQYYLVKIFHDPEINKVNSQLVFTTHNTRFLQTDFFKREQIWFTEKSGETKSTDVYSLFDYEKRQDKAIEKSYFLGRYGGLPDIKYGKF